MKDVPMTLNEVVRIFGTFLLVIAIGCWSLTFRENEKKEPVDAFTIYQIKCEDELYFGHWVRYINNGIRFIDERNGNHVTIINKKCVLTQQVKK